MADWILHLVPNKTEKLFIQPFADRDSVPFSNLSAPNGEVLAQYVEIAKQCARYVAIRG